MPVTAGYYTPEDSPRWRENAEWPAPMSATVEVMDQTSSATYGGEVAMSMSTDTTDPGAEELVELTVDYTGFEHALGGDYGSGADSTRGHVTATRVLDDWDGDTRQYVTTAQTAYDDLGRVTSTIDALDRTTTTAYTPAGMGPLTQTVVSNPAGHTTTATHGRYTGQPTKVVDANSKVTQATYDPLGRLRRVWFTDRDKNTQSPSVEYTYRVSANEPAAVTTKRLLPDGGYASSVQLYDSLLRERQSQVPSARDGDTGRVITSTEFDSRGLPVTVKGPFHNDTANPETAIVDPEIVDPALTVQRRVESSYDGAGRQTREELWSHQTHLTTTTTGYGGDRTHTTPPTGGTATTEITDARGNIIEKRDYTEAGTPSGAYQATTYSYTPRDELATVTDPAGNMWSYTYDLRGRRVEVDDPDAGVSTTTHNAMSQVTSTTDARGETVTYTYDVLGRKTATHDGAGTLLSERTYDTLEKGQLSSSTSYTDGDPYTRSVTGYDDGYRPLGETVTIPSAQGGLAGDYPTNWTYNEDGSVDLQYRPAIGGQPREILDYHYDAVGNQEWVSGARTYAADASYTPYGELEQLALGANYRRGAWQTITYDEGTRRLDRVRLDRVRVDLEGVNNSVINRRYGWDDAGNPRWIADYAGADDRQCFQYDLLRRLVQAWTHPDPGCVTNPTADDIGGPAPYWHTYSYDTAGNRTQLVEHGIDGDADTTTTYTYPAAGEDQPHTLTSLGSTTYSYDAAGNTTEKQRPGAEGPLTWSYEWDAQGRLVSAGTPGWIGGVITGGIIYDADGTRLIRENPAMLASDSTVTLFVHGDEITLDPSSGEISAVRYYTLAGKTIAVQEGADTHTERVVSTTVTDHFGTPLMSIDENNNITERFQDPFGNLRGSPANLPGDLGFHTGIEDNRTGLIQMGARPYDPDTGRFLTVDPLIDVLDSQQINGYTYANNNPLAYTDPTGLALTQGTVTDGGGPGYGGSQRPTCSGPGCYEPSAENSSKDTVDPDVETAKDATDAYQNGIDPDWANLLSLDCGNPANYTSCPNGPGNPNAGQLLTNVAAELLGVNDARDCVTGDSYGSCAWAILAFTPARFLKYLKFLDEAAEAASTSARACSFGGATLVLMADGTRKRIEDVEVGDLVIATDPETGEHEAKRVEHVFVHDDTVVNLIVGGEIVATTEDHRFWSVTDQRFKRADELEVGEQVLAADGRSRDVVGLALESNRQALAYNLSVEGIHTYHVGEASVLVHNNCFTALDALNDRRALHGLKPSQIDDLARNAGLEVAPGKVGAKNPATRYYLPGTNRSQGFRVLPRGVAGESGVKGGPYLKYFGGPLHGKRVELGAP